MRAEIIGVGNQTRYHSLFDGAEKYLRQEFSALGITLGGMRLVPGRTAEVFAQLLEGSRQSDLVVVLAAPEPAAAQAVCDAVCEGLRLEPRTDSSLARQLSRRAAQSGHEYSRAQVEAFTAVPSGSRRILNNSGLVQGYAISAKKQLMLVLPAVPSELMSCFSSSVRQLLSGVGGSSSAQRTLWAVELGETSVRSILGSLVYSQNPRVALQGQGGECEIHITATGQGAQGLCDQMAETIAQRLGPLLTSAKGEPLNQHIGRLMEKHGLTLSAAEAGTAGGLAAAIKSGGSSEKIFSGGMTLSSERDMAERLGVERSLLAKAGGVSRRVAAAMAAAVRKKGKSKLGLAVTCATDPQDPKMGQVCAAVTDGITVWAKKLVLPAGSPAEAIRTAAALQAMNMLRLYLQRYPKALPGGEPLEEAVPGSVTLGDKMMAAVSGIIPTVKAASNKGGEHKNHQSEKESKEMNLIQKIRYGKLTKNDSIRLGVLGLSLVVFVGCIIYISSVYAESHKNKGLIQDQQSAYSNSNVRPEDVDGYPNGYLDKFAALYAQNPDIAGWIKIDGTQYLDMPVVQTVDNEYYERRDFTKADNQHGVAFVDYRVAQREPSTNTIIYAHNMNDGQMFGELLKYKSIDYYRQHPLVSYDSVYYEGMYKIFGVVVCKKDDPDFLYHNFVQKGSDAEMTEFVNKIRERSILNTKVDVRTDDHLLTMSTCDYSFKSETGDRIARFVVFARKVRDGESLDVDTAGATINTNPVMPAEWYSHLKRQQEAELKRQQEEAAKKATSKWLTEKEQKELSAEEAEALAKRREEQAQNYLTYDEREDNDLETILTLIDRRKAQFELYLTEEEQGYSLTKRLNLSEERRAQATAAGLTDEEIRKAGSWENIEKLINSKGSAALDAVIKLYPNLLTAADKATATTVAALEQLAASRKQEAELLGLRVADYDSWEALQTAINQKKGAATVQKEMEDYIAQNPKFLEAADKNGANSVDDLKALVAQREKQAKDLGINPNDFSSWSALKAEIDKKNNAAATEQARQQFLNDPNNKKWISDSTKTLEELQTQVNANKAAYDNAMAALKTQEAKDKLASAMNSAGSWSDVQNAINSVKDAATPPPSSSSSTSSSTGSSSTGSSSTPPPSSSETSSDTSSSEPPSESSSSETSTEPPPSSDTSSDESSDAGSTDESSSEPEPSSSEPENTSPSSDTTASDDPPPADAASDEPSGAAE